MYKHLGLPYASILAGQSRFLDFYFARFARNPTRNPIYSRLEVKTSIFLENITF